MDRFRQAVDSFRAVWAGLPASYRVLSGLLTILLALVAVWGIGSAGRENMVRIADGQTIVSQRAEITSKLRELGIRTKVEGDSVYVPADQADGAMLQLHGSGVLGDDAVFRYLQESSLFTTRDQSDRRWLVAVQQKLQRMILSLDYVRSVGVQIAGQSEAKRLGWANGSEAAAAVVIDLKPGQAMTPPRVVGIAALVSAGMPGLKASGVKILDRSGRPYRVPEAAMMDGYDLRGQEIAYASMIEEKALGILPENSRARATIRLSPEDRHFEKRTVERNASDAENGPLRADEVYKPEGIEGTARETKEDTIEKRKSSAGSPIDSVSIAVVIPDDAREVPAGDSGRPKYLREQEGLVRAAIGATDKDTVSIQIRPASKMQVTQAVVERGEPPVVWQPQPGTIFLAVLGFAGLFVAYRLLRSFSPAAPDGGVVSEESLRPPGESILSAQDEVFDRMREGVRDSVAKNPREAADVVRRWMTP
jgi:flagellar biosynthesis/type III secretory pathway M-ring protein FliF/YscJ